MKSTRISLVLLAALVVLPAWSAMETTESPPENSLSVLDPHPFLQTALDPEAFVAAARRGDEGWVRKSLEQNPKLVEAKDGMGLTALDWATTMEHWVIVRELLAAGSDVQNVGFDGGTVLHRMAHHDQPALARLLLDAGADPNLQNQWGRTALHVAVRRGRLEVAKVLLQAGSELDRVTREEWTPLHVAYMSGQPEMVEWLQSVGADEEARDQEGRIPADYFFQRPAEWMGTPHDLHTYQGHYRVTEDFAFTLRVKNGQLTLQDFSVETLYPTGPDTFFGEAEPWEVRFIRGHDGTVRDIEVQFLRRTEHGTRIDYPEYVGSQVCGECHGVGEDAPYIPWLRSRHGSAYWRLATDWALILAHQRPHFQDLTDPITDSRCLNCHTTAALDEGALFAESFRVEEGVGCETCHGPGSKYIDPGVMADRKAFLAAGGRIPDEATCTGCHRDPETFSFEDWWPRIAHGKEG